MTAFLFATRKPLGFNPRIRGSGGRGSRCFRGAEHPAVPRAEPGGEGAGAHGAVLATRGSQISYRGEALSRSPPPPRDGMGARFSRGTPRLHGQLPSSSPPKGQGGLGSAVSQPLRLPLIHFTLSILIGSALSPASPPPSYALPPSPPAAAPLGSPACVCCMIHTNSLTQGNQWARKSTRSKARSLSGDRPPNKETQRAAARYPLLAPGAPRGGRGTPLTTRRHPSSPLRCPSPGWDGVRVLGRWVVWG